MSNAAVVMHGDEAGGTDAQTSLVAERTGSTMQSRLRAYAAEEARKHSLFPQRSNRIHPSGAPRRNTDAAQSRGKQDQWDNRECHRIERRNG